MLLGVITLQVKAQNIATDTAQYRFTLEQAQNFAIEHYFMSLNAGLDVEAAKKKIWESTAMGLPQISGEAAYSYLPEIPELAFPVTVMGANKGDTDPIVGGDFRDPNFYSIMPGEPIKMAENNNITYNLTVSQLIFSGEYIVGLQASKTYKTYAQENFEMVKIDIRENVASNYFGLLILEKNREVITNSLANLNLTLEHTKKFFEQGLVEDTEVDQLSLTVKRTENSLRMIENQIAYMEKMLKYQLGLQATEKVELTDNIVNLVSLNIIDPSGYTFELDNHITYKLLTTGENLQNLNLKHKKSTFLPTLAGFYQYSDQVKQPDFNTNIKHIFGVQLSVPILSSGMRLAQVGQARIELDKAHNMRTQESERLIFAAEQALFNYNTSLENYYNEKENFELSERVFNKGTVRHAEGIMSALDLSILNNQYLQAQLSYATAIQKLLTDKVALDKAYSKL